MTKEELAKRYKEIEIKQITDDILEVNLWKDKTHPSELHVKIIFAYDKLYYTGDFGTFVFGKYVRDIRTFFQGDEINPYYWMEKCEASSEPVLDEHIDLEKCRQKVSDYIFDNFDLEGMSKSERKEYKKNEQEEVDDLFCNLEGYYLQAIDQIADFFWTLRITLKLDKNESHDIAQNIVHDCRLYSEYYLYACEVIQWVENNLEEWLSENQESRKAMKIFLLTTST